MLHDVKKNLGGFREQGRIRLLSLPQRLVGSLRVFDLVHHKLSKYCCISSGVLHTTVSPSADSLRAFLILVRSAGVIVLSWRTTCTEATPRINSKAFLISDNAAPSSSVTITWYDFGVDVPVSILFYNYALLNANFY